MEDVFEDVPDVELYLTVFVKKRFTKDTLFDIMEKNR